MKYTFSSTFFESITPVSFVKLFQHNSDNELLEMNLKRRRHRDSLGEAENTASVWPRELCASKSCTPITLGSSNSSACWRTSEINHQGNGLRKKRRGKQVTSHWCPKTMYLNVGEKFWRNATPECWRLLPPLSFSSLQQRWHFWLWKSLMRVQQVFLEYPDLWHPNSQPTIILAVGVSLALISHLSKGHTH